MGLPDVPLPTGTVAVNGTDVAVRGLSRAEVLRLAAYRDDPDGLDVYVLARGAGVSDDEAAAWRETAPAGVVDEVVNRIVELSGLGDEVSKSNGAGPAPKGS